MAFGVLSCSFNSDVLGRCSEPRPAIPDKILYNHFVSVHENCKGDGHLSFKMVNQKFELHYDNVDLLFEDLHKANANTNNIIYRGISYDSERYPGIMRVRSHTPEKSHNLYRKEFDMLQEFRHESASSLGNCFSALDFVCAAQHYGIPTRLIDWTYNPFVALYFALSAQVNIESKDFQYRILCGDVRNQLAFTDIYHSLTVGQYSNLIADGRVEHYKSFVRDISVTDKLIKKCKREGMKDCESKINNFIVLRPGNSNARINAQKGLFVIPRTLDKRKIDEEYRDSGVQTITLSSEIRREALKHLANLGYSRLHLFCDLQNICQHIKESALPEDMRWRTCSKKAAVRAAIQSVKNHQAAKGDAAQGNKKSRQVEYK